jgi:hypothetical protein
MVETFPLRLRYFFRLLYWLTSFRNVTMQIERVYDNR